MSLFYIFQLYSLYLMRFNSCLLILFICSLGFGQSEETTKVKDSIKKVELLNHLSNGYFPTKHFNFDLRYLIKYNQYEGFRTGIGGVTNQDFSSVFRIEGYGVYGFLDKDYKFSLGAGVRIDKQRNTWITLKYTDDLQETGSSSFITDKRFFQFFEPRLINIEQFHKHITKSLSIEHQLTPKVLTETKFSISKIDPTYTYTFAHEELGDFNNFNLTTGTLSAQWSPFSKFKHTPNGIVETVKGFPKFTFQYTKSFNDFINSEFSFSKFDFRAIQQFNYNNNSLTEIVITGGLADGDIPITHLYHAFPNNVNKETILQRFSVAGNNSFETMFFGEFFSDTFINLQIKHKFKYWEISPWLKPQFTLISRHAIGDMNNKERHQGLTFNTLNKGFSEIGLEINRLFFGFGLSFAYRYGAYHFSRFDDNFAFKFTFNIDIKK